MENVKKFIGFEQGAPRSPDDGTYVSNYGAPDTYGGSAVPTSPFRWRSASYGNWAKFGHPSDGYGNRNRNPGCFRCGNLKHRVRNCPVSSTKHRRPEPRQTIPLQPPTQQQPDVRPAGNQQCELLQIRRVLNRIADSVAAFRKEVEKKFVELEQRIPKVDETNHTNFNRLPNCNRISQLSCHQDSEKETEQRPDEHGVRDTITIVKSPTFKLNTAPSITDLTYIQEEEDPQNCEGKTPEMSSVTRLVSPRRGDILEGEMVPYIPSSPVGELSPQATVADEPQLENMSERERRRKQSGLWGKSVLEVRSPPTGRRTHFPF